MPLFSLIVATKYRVEELARLIRSVECQGETDYELLIVDQNDDDRLLPIIQNAQNPERIRHIKCSIGVSHARNVGMNWAQGSLLGFPDDDCWYPDDLLRKVAEWFAAHQSYEILSLTSRNEDGVCTGNGWFQDSCDQNLLNVYRTSIGYAFFIRAQGAAQTVRFDERIGPGAESIYLGGEDSDFVLQALQQGARGRFEAKWYVGHPRKDIRNASVSSERVYIYGLGMGFVQRKHGLGWLSALLASYDFARAIASFMRGKRLPAKLFYRHGRGILAGFFAPASDRSHARG
jgi:glycosyltransferase involved in cell wall biosynthesis